MWEWLSENGITVSLIILILFPLFAGGFIHEGMGDE